ncbi:MAG: DNA repair protein RecO (recombination protein O) [Planctomycetota bacterium]|jgi:DNA repair protein RecO (recombination protein O)
MLIKTEGIILKTIKYRETSLIVKAYTASHGLLSFIINGVRTAKNTNKAVLFQPLNFLDLIVYYKENKGLLHLKEYNFNFLYQDIPFNIIKSSIAIFMLEMLEHTLSEEEENEELYDFIKNAFVRLDLGDNRVANFHLDFLIDLMYFKGIQPQGKHSEKTPFFNIKEGEFTNEVNSFGYLSGIIASNFSSLLYKEELILTKTERKQLLDTLIQYYSTHIDNFRKVNSLDVLESVLG